MSSTTVNAINHSVQYLIHEVDIMFIVIKHRLKHCKLQYQTIQSQSKLQNSLILVFI